MKFSDGNWLLQKDVTAQYPTQTLEVDRRPDGGIEILCPFRRYEGRASSVDCGALTLTYTAPMPGIIGVTITHHAGSAKIQPGFPINTTAEHKLEAQITQDAIVLTSGELSVALNREAPLEIVYRAGDRVLTSTGMRRTAYYTRDTGAYISEQLRLGVGEAVYGLGERFTSFIKNGQSVDIWNEDGGTSSEQSYKNIPFYMTNKGYGVFVAHAGRVSFEVASEKVTQVQFSVPGEEMTYYLIYGPTPAQILERYTALTGRPALPPAWSFGLWLSTSFTTNYDEATVTSFIDGCLERRIPLRVFHFDCFWMKGFHWSDFLWDSDVFPNPREMLSRIKARGIEICVWINPYIAQRSALFAEGKASGYFVKTPTGDVWQWDRWQYGMALVDFTNPDAVRWYQSKLRGLMDMGVDCFKTDFGERIPVDVVYHGGQDPVWMHNYYTLLYNRAVFDLLLDVKGENNAVLFARSATVGSQMYPVHWGGDCSSNYESMAESLRGGLSLTLSGFGFWSHDIGGFEDTSTPDVYKRWAAFGLLSSHSRLHGSKSYRVPWAYDEESVAVVSYFTRLKNTLMPYLYAAAVQTHETGVPMMRAMPLAFPDDPACTGLDRQYMLGESLLVAPVFSADGVVEYYAPEGEWTNLITGATVQGGKWQREQHGYMSLPLLARQNSVIPVGNRDDRPDYPYAEGIVFQVYGLSGNASCTLMDMYGAPIGVFEMEKDGDAWRIRCTVDGARALLRNRTVSKVEGATATQIEMGTLVSGISQGARVWMA